LNEIMAAEAFGSGGTLLQRASDSDSSTRSPTPKVPQFDTKGGSIIEIAASGSKSGVL
jgi:hypothetical protein